MSTLTFTPLPMGAGMNMLCERQRCWVPGPQPQPEGRERAALHPAGPGGCWGGRHRVCKTSAPGVSGLWCWICVLAADERSLALACQYVKSGFIAFFNGTNLVHTSERLSQILLWGRELHLLSVWFCVFDRYVHFFVCKGVRQMYAKSTWTSVLKFFCCEKLQGDYKTQRI